MNRSGRRYLSLVLAMLTGTAAICRGAGEPGAIVSFDRPFLFAYGTWEKKATIENGAAHLDADGMTPKGGAGVNQDLDLAPYADDCPALRVQVGAGNTLKTLRLMLNDTAGHSGTWNFALPPAPTAAPVILTPQDGAAFSQPNEIGKTGAPELSRIMQWQLMGDWGGDGPVRVVVTSLTAAPPDDAIRKARAERVARDEQARIQAERDRLAARAQYKGGTADSPEIQSIYVAAPGILALQVHSGKITPAHLSDYTPQPGDVKDDHGGKDHPHLIRNGKDLGFLIGPPGKENGVVSPEGFSGNPLLLTEADDPANYTITSPDDPAFAAGVAPVQVMRKSKTDDWQQPTLAGITVQHNIYLKLPHPLLPGKTYRVAVGHLNTRQSDVTLNFDPAKTWTESIHVNQVGFRPDDPLKRAYLSLWMGDGRGVDFPAGLTFHLVDVITGKSVFTGTVGAAWPADKPEKMATTRNFNGTSVAPIDFSSFNTPGRYCVEVDGVGCSYPFDIGASTWEKAFWVQMKGFYNQRSGIDLGPPYTDFVRPACFKLGVNDCMPITQSTYSMLDGGNGQDELAKHDTGKLVPEAWGGYNDAGDWNPRRISHMMTTTFWQLELLQLFPAYFRSLKLNIPNDAPGPDLLKECLFELSLYHRLQLPDGGVRFGIETDGDPWPGEVSWKQNMPAYVYAPDMQSSYQYAAVASRASAILEAYDPALAKTYRESAIKAMEWAEQERAKRIAAGKRDDHPDWTGGIPADRNLAAACLLALTHDARWNTLFLEDTPLKSANPPAFRGNDRGRDAAFTYARLPEGVGDPNVKQTARKAILTDADGSLAYEQNNAFGIASEDPGKPHFLGFYSTPHGAVSLVRAYQLAGDRKYLAGAVQACLFPDGANPSNLVYTTGVGANPVQHALNLDSLATGQKVPVGLTPYGIVDLQQWHDTWITWPITWFVGKGCQPAITDWPTTESFLDVRMMPAEDEFTTDQTLGPNAYVWGFLAARR